MTTLKIKIKLGDTEIEAEGSKSDLEGLIEDWWKRVQHVPSSAPNPEVHARGPGGSKRSSSRSRGRAAAPSAGENGTDTKTDLMPIVNAIKQHPKFPALRTKILQAKPRYPKVLLVCHMANQPLTSGEIHRALYSLGVKLNVQGVSTVIDRNQESFMSREQRKLGAAPRYELTSHAQDEVQKLINE